jgi:hypothetical protein
VEWRRARVIGTGALALLVAACAVEPRRDTGDGRLTIEDRRAPEVLDREGPAVSDAGNGAAGFWAAVPGLPRPERAVAINLASRAEVEVALFAAPRSSGTIRLSHEAAAALGIGDAPARVRLVAVRSRPSIDFNRW